jgi:N,N'-diacetyllegionaminate synthase
MSCFVIAEAGVNHNGDEGIALRMVEAAAQAGADAVKFQTFRADRLVAPGTRSADYQIANAGQPEQLELLRGLELSPDAHRRVAALCARLKIEFMSTPFDEEAVDFLVSLGMRRLKMPSGEITNFPLLRHAARAGLPMIVSTGMADLEEVSAAVEFVASHLPASTSQPAITVLHCTSMYPAHESLVNLRAMQTLADRLRVPVGYSDHTLGTHVSIAAVALGATVIEKHFTLDRTLPGPDHAASLDATELAAMVRSIRGIEVAMGDGVKRPTAEELPVRALVRRSVACARMLEPSHVLRAEDLQMMRPGTGIPPADLHKVVGHTLRRQKLPGELLAWEDFL